MKPLWHTAHCTLNTAICTLHIAHCTLHTAALTAFMCCRWYFWYMEVYRMLVLMPHVERFQAEYEGLDEALVLEPKDWHNLEMGLLLKPSNII